MSIRQVGEIRSQTDATSVIFVEVVDDDGTGRVVYEAHCDTCEAKPDAPVNLGQFDHLQDALDLLADHSCATETT